MDPELRAQLERIFAAIAVISPASWTCGGEVTTVKAEELHSKLTDFLYGRCYMCTFRETAPGPVAGREPGGDLTALLRDAHPGRPRRDAGWRVAERLEGGWIVARKGGAARRFGPGRYLVMDGAFGPPEEGQPLVAWPGRDSLTVQPSHYYAFGETVGESPETEDILRFYWNVAAGGAPPLLHALAAGLNRFQTPFHFKLPKHRADYGRHDAGVLYVNRRYYRIAAMVAADVHAQIGEHLRPETPLFTKRLARGLGLAEDPRESFGKNRCGMVADALRAAFDKELHGPEQKLEELGRQFGARGLALDRPYLNAGSRDDYDFSGNGGPHRRADLP